MVMPETGEAELPTIPTILALTVRGGEVGERADLGSGDGVKLQEDPHEDDQKDGPAEDDGHREVVLGAERLGRGLSFILAHGLQPCGQCAEDGGRGAEQRDEARCGDGSRAHGPDVGLP